MLPLEGKTAIVTGAGGGIGTPLVRLLVERGADVLGIDRTLCATATFPEQMR